MLFKNAKYRIFPPNLNGFGVASEYGWKKDYNNSTSPAFLARTVCFSLREESLNNIPVNMNPSSNMPDVKG
jgi:hypothetical protein